MWAPLRSKMGDGRRKRYAYTISRATRHILSKGWRAFIWYLEGVPVGCGSYHPRTLSIGGKISLICYTLRRRPSTILKSRGDGKIRYNDAKGIGYYRPVVRMIQSAARTLAQIIGYPPIASIHSLAINGDPLQKVVSPIPNFPSLRQLISIFLMYRCNADSPNVPYTMRRVTDAIITSRRRTLKGNR